MHFMSAANLQQSMVSKKRAKKCFEDETNSNWMTINYLLFSRILWLSICHFEIENQRKFLKIYADRQVEIKVCLHQNFENTARYWASELIFPSGHLIVNCFFLHIPTLENILYVGITSRHEVGINIFGWQFNLEIIVFSFL